MPNCSSCWRWRISAAGNALFAQRARETVRWLKREMTTTEGAFCASLDADSEGEEGKFYVWSKNEIIELLGPDAGEFFAHHYDVSDDGNFEGHNILNRLDRVERGPAEEAAAGAVARHFARRARGPRAARSRRQGAGRLERPDDRRAGQCRRHSRRAGMARHGAARLRLHRAGDEQGRTPRAFLSRRQAVVSGSRLRFRRDDPRRARALRSDWRTSLSRSGATLAARFRCALHQHRDRRLLSERRRRRPICCCGRIRPSTTRSPIRIRWRPAIWCGWPCWPATTPSGSKVDRLLEHIIAASAQNLFGHIALLNALDLRLRAAEIVCTGADAEHFAQAGAAPAVPRSHRAAGAGGSRSATVASGAGKAEIARGQRRLHLRRPDLLAAGAGTGQDRRDCRCDAAAGLRKGWTADRHCGQAHGKSESPALNCCHALQARHLEHQFRPPAHRSGRQIPQERAAGCAVPAGDQVPGRCLSDQALQAARLRALRAQRPEGLSRRRHRLAPSLRELQVRQLLRQDRLPPHVGGARRSRRAEGSRHAAQFLCAGRR